MTEFIAKKFETYPSTQKIQTAKQTFSINRTAQIVSSSAFNEATGHKFKQISFSADFNYIFFK
jgi:hypothetical protein